MHVAWFKVLRVQFSFFVLGLCHMPCYSIRCVRLRLGVTDRRERRGGVDNCSSDARAVFAFFIADKADYADTILGPI